MKSFLLLVAVGWLALSGQFIFHVPSSSTGWSGILDPARAIDWTTAGISGGIPTGWSDCTNAACNTAFSTPTAANINTACAGAPSSTVVRIPAGSITITTAIHCNRSNVILRGAGPTQTTITLSGANILMGNGSGGQGSYPSTPVQTSWTGGLTRGSTVLTVASTTNLRAGQTVILDELNPAWVFPDGGSEGVCTSGNSCGRNDSPAGFFGSSTRAAPQMTKIVTVDSSTQITVRDPVGYTHTSGLTPQVFSWSESGAFGNKEYLGVENMKVNAGGEAFALSFPFCDYCWLKNVEIGDAGRGAVWFFYSYGGVVSNNYIWHTAVAGGPTQYGVDLNISSNQLVENNIIYNVTSPLVPETTYGVVWSYNYMRNVVADNLFASFTGHLAHESFNLLEGNIGQRLSWDNAWGGGSHNTMFRNRADGGVSANKTNYRYPVGLYSHHRFNNLVGNVWGDTSASWMTAYTCDDTNELNANEGFVYDIGGWNACDSASPRDTVTRTSLMRWGNWDKVTYAASGSSNGTRWCTGSGAGSSGSDAYNTACTASERAEADATFPGLSSPSTTLPSSFYLSAKPSWFGSVTYPPIGPDVTGGNISNVGGHAYKIPAQVCYDNSSKDANGYLTAFDATACY